jgi:hypothetical protein
VTRRDFVKQAAHALAIVAIMIPFLFVFTVALTVTAAPLALFLLPVELALVVGAIIGLVAPRTGARLQGWADRMLVESPWPDRLLVVVESAPRSARAPAMRGTSFGGSTSATVAHTLGEPSFALSVEPVELLEGRRECIREAQYSLTRWERTRDPLDRARLLAAILLLQAMVRAES